MTCRVLRCIGVGLTIAALAGCGADSGEVRAESATTRNTELTGSPDALPSYRATEGDPNELVSYSQFGAVDHAYEFTSYEQLRDYSDAAVIGTLQDVRVVSRRPDDGVGSGRIEFDFELLMTLGGQTRVTRNPEVGGDRFTVVLPLAASDAVVAQLGERLDPLLGSARYLMFLNHEVVSGADGGLAKQVTYVPAYLGEQLSWIFAESPADAGDLAIPNPKQYLAAEAVARGEEVTGTSSPPLVVDEYTTDRGEPAGVSLNEAARSLAGEVGHPSTEEPPRRADFLARLKIVEPSSPVYLKDVFSEP
jgi:hypothetical protein